MPFLPPFLTPFAPRSPSPHHRLPRRLPLAVLIASLCASAAYAQSGDVALKEVVISASGFEQEIKEAPASITVVTRKELEQKRFNNIAQALEDIQGVDVGAATDKTGGLNIGIRGMPSDYTLILIDGRRQNAAGNVAPNDFMGTQTSFLPPLSAIERIEVIRGPMSTLYGSDAMGGVVNIITRKVGKAWTGALGADVAVQQESSFGDTRAARFYLSGPLQSDVAGLALRGSTFHRDAADVRYLGAGGKEQIPVMGANPAQSDVHNLGARLTLTPNRHHDITLDVDLGRQTYDNEGNRLGTQGVKGGYGPELKFNRDQIALAHTGRYGFGTWETSFQVNDTETIGRTIPPKTPGAIEGSARELTVRSQVLDSKLMLPWGTHLSTLGGQWWKADMKDGVASERFRFTQKAVFAEDEWSLLPHFKLTVGARYDHHSIFGGKASPRVYGVWNAAPEWTIKGGMAYGYKTPRVEQIAPGINGFGGQGTIPLVGTPTLKPETSQNVELGLHFAQPQGLSASATVFNNRFKDKITSGPGLPNCSYTSAPNRPGCADFGPWPNVDLFGQQVNVDRAVTRGIELQAKLPLSQTWAVSGNYTYTDSEQKSGANAGKPLTDTPEHALNARLDWSPSAQWNTWLRLEYRSTRFRDPGTTAANQAAAAALGDYKAYTLVHVGGAWTINKQWSINAAVYNLLNKNFVDYQLYAVPGAAAQAGNAYRNPQEGRRLWLSANYSF